MPSASAATRPSAEVKRICLLSAEYPPALGGVGDYTRLLADALARAGLACCVLTTSRPHTPAEDPPGVPVQACVADWRFGSWREVAGVVRSTAPQVLHIQYQTAAYGMQPAINLLPWRLRTLGLGVHVVTTFHDLRPPYLFPKAGALRHLPALALAWASDAFVLVTPEHWQEPPLRWLRRLRRDLGGKAHVIPIGSNVAPAPPSGYDRAAWRARLGVDTDDVLLAYFGFLNRSKGVDDLLVALRMLLDRGRQCKLLMVGGAGAASNASDREWARAISALAAKLRLGEAVTWTGYAPAAEVSAHLLAADLCVLPFRDGATFQRGTLMAALAHGLPVVSTRPAVPVDALPPSSGDEQAALRHGENLWLVPPADPQALAEAIEQVGDDPALRERLRAGALRVAAAVSWDGIARRHLALYAGLASR